jgi:hypothetical protein
VGQALATEAIAECIRSEGLWEAESNIKLLGLVSTPAAADWDASFTVECINLKENTAKSHAALALMSKADPKSPDNDLDLPMSSSGRSEVDLDQPL